MRNLKIFVPAIIIIGVIVAYLFLDSKKEDYIQSIIDHRIQVDSFMKNSDESPFNSTDVNYTGLDYFKPDASYKLEASYQPFGNRKIKMLTTSDGKEEAYEEYGTAYFIIEGVQNELVILKSVSSTTYDLFIPFADASSGEATYGGGRYLNVTLGVNDLVELDFNKAYNPYCAYAPAYSCPLPPSSNILSIPILAGEKNFVGK